MSLQKINDVLNFLAKLTLAKCLNASKVFLSYYWSRLFNKPWVLGMPMAVSVEPTTACNLSCPECPSGLKSFTRPTGKIDVAVFQQQVDALQHTLIYLSFYFHGEPYLHKGFLDMVAMPQAWVSTLLLPPMPIFWMKKMQKRQLKAAWIVWSSLWMEPHNHLIRNIELEGT